MVNTLEEVTMNGKENRLKMKEAIETLKPKSDANGGFWVHKNFMKVVGGGFIVVIGVILTLLQIRQELSGQIKGKMEEQKQKILQELNIGKKPDLEAKINSWIDTTNSLKTEQRETAKKIDVLGVGLARIIVKDNRAVINEDNWEYAIIGNGR
jgi:hypothetical protein